MKRQAIKRVFLILFLFLLIFGVGQNVAHAFTDVFYIPIFNLDHSKAYSWGINKTLPENQVITDAKMWLFGINNWDMWEEDILYVDLLEDAPKGLRTYTDNQAAGDYFLTTYYDKDKASELFTWSDDNQRQVKKWYWDHGLKWKWVWTNPPSIYAYDFDSSQIEYLNQAIEDGNFGFGFDPDCHYDLLGIGFQFNTECKTVKVPEPTTLSLLIPSFLFGVNFIRKNLKKERR